MCVRKRERDKVSCSKLAKSRYSEYDAILVANNKSALLEDVGVIVNMILLTRALITNLS